MVFVGRDESGERMEILELAASPADHPFYVAAQFHPEFKSRPGKPSPLFLGFILASAKRLDSYLRRGRGMGWAAGRGRGVREVVA